MNPTDTITPEEELRQRLEEAQRELDAAEQARGAVHLDGGDAKAANDRVASARSAIEGLEAATVELADRRRQEREAQAEHTNRVMKWRELSWYAELVERLPDVIRLREELATAEAHLVALGNAQAAVGGRPNYCQPDVVGNKLPAIPAEDYGLTVGDCDEWAKKLAPHVKAAAKAIGGDADPSKLPWAGAS